MILVVVAMVVVILHCGSYDSIPVAVVVAGVLVPILVVYAVVLVESICVLIVVVVLAFRGYLQSFLALQILPAVFLSQSIC